MKLLFPAFVFFFAVNSQATVLSTEQEPLCEITGAPLSELPEDIRAIARYQNCEELPVGGVRVSRVDPARFAMSGDYSLKRISEKTYQARLNVNFNDGAGPGSGARMFARSRECIAQAYPNMKGPNGEQLDIQIMTPQEIETLPSAERPRQLNIGIDNPGQGGHSYNFPNNFPCQSIVHEFLHHLGLCDEYNPVGNWTGSEQAAGAACRVIVKNSSYLMNRPDGAWPAYFNRDPNDPPRREQSFLAPNHFYKILEMDCWGKSANYQLCGTFSYRGTNCEQVPAVCQNEDFYLGAPPPRSAPAPQVRRNNTRRRRR